MEVKMNQTNIHITNNTKGDSPPSTINLITDKQLHRIIGRSVSSLRKDRMSGKGVPYIKYPSGCVYYDMRDVVAFIESNKRQFTSQDVKATSNKTPNYNER